MSDRVPLAELRAFVADVLVRQGLPSADAATVAARMIEADIRGMDGHGVIRLPNYVRHLEAGGFNPRPEIRVLHETPISALVDGDNGMGHVVVTAAVQLAITKARASGLAWVGIRGSNHAGAGGVYASMALEHDLLALYGAVGNANHLPPWGGTDPLMSTNPIAVAIPAGQEPPVVLDMATTVASYGKVKVAAQRGETMPEGWMVDRHGAPLTDPTRADEGFLLPIGGAKGYGLGLVVGLLAGVMNGAAFGSQVVDFNADASSPTNTGQMILVARPDLFRPLEEFKADIDARVRELRESTPIAGGPPVRIPGERVPERQRAADDEGVPLTTASRDALVELGRRLGADVEVLTT